MLGVARNPVEVLSRCSWQVPKEPQLYVLSVIKDGTKVVEKVVVCTYREMTIRHKATSDTNITVPLLAGNLPLIIHCCA